MKRQTKRRIMALVMAALMVVGLIPTGFTAITAKASAGKKYSFEAQVWKQLPQASLKIAKLSRQEQMIILHFI